MTFNHKLQAINNNTYLHLKPYLTGFDLVLDVGSGDGLIAKTIKEKNGAKVVSIDIIDISKTNIKPLIFDGMHIPFPDNSFGISLCCFVLHHAKYPERLLKEIKRVTKTKVIIMEDIPETVLDSMLIFGHKIISKIKYQSTIMKFKKDAEWKLLFKKNYFTVEKNIKIKKDRDWLYPVSRKMYVLKNKS